MDSSSSTRYERELVGILFFTWGTVFLDRMTPLYLAPFFAPEFHLTNVQIGMLASVLAITWAISTFFFGALSDRVGRKRVLIPAVFAFSILSWLSGWVHSFSQLLWIRALVGLAEGPTWSIMTALIEESSDVRRRGGNIGFVVSAAALVGLAAAPLLTTPIAVHWGWRSAFFLAAVPGLIMGALILKFVKEPPRKEGKISEKPTFEDYASILRYRNMWLCCIGAAGFMSWLFALNVFAPLYITEVAHQSPIAMGRFLGATGLGSFFLGFLLPGLSDRIGRKPVLLFSAAISAVIPLAFLVPALYVYPFLLAAIVFVTNSGQGIASLIMVLVPTETVPPQFHASSIGLATLVGEIFGATAAPIVVGKLAEKYGLGFSMWMAALGSAVVFAVGLLLKETRHQHRTLTDETA